MTNAIQKKSPNADFLPANIDSNQRYRFKRYITWLDENNLHWQSVPLVQYKLWLDSRFAPTTVRALVSTVRMRYKDITGDNQYRDFLYSKTNPDAPMDERKAFVDEMIVRISNAISDRRAKVQVVEKQDRTDQEFVRLTYEQVQRLVEVPHDYWLQKYEAGKIDENVTWTARAVRDSAIMALIGCTGLREGECASLNVDDLYQTLNDLPAIRVAHGKGAVQRVVPLGELDWFLGYVDQWRALFDIKKGALFPAFTSRYCTAVRNTHCSTETINSLFQLYTIDGLTVTPHTLRRSYASYLYRYFGMDIYKIQRNLGHKRIETTLHYIGEQNLEERAPRLSRQ